VRAAGGVPFRRRGDGEIEVLLVHRPKYSDWTFPKGKVKEGERDEVAAVREVEEETGLRCGLGPELASTQYADPKLRKKTVRYWAMDSCSGRFQPNAEVDEVAWLTPVAAAERLSYARDREVLRSLADGR
jgi:8-oxo-dGTP diphosphatase